MCKPILQTSAFFGPYTTLEDWSKQICISRPKINERAVHVYIYNLTVNLSIFCNNFVRFLEDAGRNSLVPFCSIACYELHIF